VAAADHGVKAFKHLTSAVLVRRAASPLDKVGFFREMYLLMVFTVPNPLSTSIIMMLVLVQRGFGTVKTRVE
jgi:hypothetical protein